MIQTLTPSPRTAVARRVRAIRWAGRAILAPWSRITRWRRATAGRRASMGGESAEFDGGRSGGRRANGRRRRRAAVIRMIWRMGASGVWEGKGRSSVGALCSVSCAQAGWLTLGALPSFAVKCSGWTRTSGAVGTGETFSSVYSACQHTRHSPLTHTARLANLGVALDSRRTYVGACGES